LLLSPQSNPGNRQKIDKGRAKEKTKSIYNRISIMSAKPEISLEKAYALCKNYREEKGVRMFSQCWGCVKFSKEVPEKMCFYNPPNNDGCKIVNKLFEESNRNERSR
jgi:hypothetical protein